MESALRKPPLSFLGYAHALGEALQPIIPSAQRWCSAVTLVYVALGTIDRGRVAYDLERVQHKRRNAGVRAALDSGFRDWFTFITLQPACVSLTTGLAASALHGRAGVPAAVARYGPAGAGVAALLATAPLCHWAANAACDFAVAPLLETVFSRADGIPEPSAEYVAPDPQELLIGPPSAIGAMELDNETRAALQWAMDGNALTPYPGLASAKDAAASGALSATPPPERSVSEAEYARVLASLQRVEREVQEHMRDRKESAAATSRAVNP